MKYYVAYSKHINSTIAIGDSLYIVQRYISQFNINNDVEIFSKFLVNGLEEESLSLFELVNITPNVILTRLEMIYYKEYLSKLYDDMKTTISSLIVYSKLGNMSNDDKIAMKNISKSLYDKMSNYESFVDSIDRNTLFTQIMQNPIANQRVMLEHISMLNRYKELQSID